MLHSRDDKISSEGCTSATEASERLCQNSGRMSKVTHEGSRSRSSRVRSPTKDDGGKSHHDNQMDSGFMSGSNLLSSSSLCSDEGKSYSRSTSKEMDSGLSRDIDDHCDGGVGYGKENFHSSDNLDSGIDLGLSERISSLNLTTSEPVSPVEPKPVQEAPSIQPEPRSKLEQLGLSPAHITILKEIFRKDDDGDTQLHIAIMRGFVEVVWHITRLLPHQALLDLPNNSGRTALHLAVGSGDARLARHLIVCGASPVARNLKGETPLHIACRNGDPVMVSGLTSQVTVYEVVSARLAYPPNHTHGLLAADLNNYDGQTCIHVAAQGGHKEILQHLTWYGADINAKECKCGRTALHYAVEARDPDLVKFLADSCRSALGIQTYSGLTPYQLALANDTPTIATLLEELGAKKDPLPSTYAVEDDLEYEDESSTYGDELSWAVDDLQIGGVSLQFSSQVAVSAHGPFNADQYL